MTVSVVAADALAISTAENTPDYTLPSGLQDGDKLLYAVDYASGVRSEVQTAGPAVTWLLSARVSGHCVSVYERNLLASDSSAVITLTVSGAIIKYIVSTIILRGVLNGPWRPVVAGNVSTTTTANHVAPAANAVGDSVEVHFAFDVRGADVPQTSSWTAPGTMTRADQDFVVSGSQQVSGAVGYNIANPISDGGAAQAGTWVADTVESGGVMTLLVPFKPPPAIWSHGVAMG